MTADVALAPARRSDRLDLARAIAMLWMAAFHACFDLNHFGLIAPQNFYADPVWTWQRAAIVSLFLLTAGAGQSAAVRQPVGRFWRRWAQIAGCALLVSAGSWLMFPDSWISFGVLHGMAAMLLLVRALQRRSAGVLSVLALAALIAPAVWSHPFFDARWTGWMGLVTHKPRTEDFVPVLPWLGVMLGGFVVGRWMQVHRPQTWQGPVPCGAGPLLKLARWPLSFYMLHQLVLIGLILLIKTIQNL